MTYVHRFSSHPELEFEALEPHFMRAYIAHVRQYEPTVPEDVAAHVVDEYVAMRNGADAATGFGFTTARTLLAILRLSQALARLHQRHEASRDDTLTLTPTLTLTLTLTLTPAQTLTSAPTPTFTPTRTFTPTPTHTLTFTLPLRLTR